MARPLTSNLAFETLWELSLLVSCQSAQDPTDAEWNDWIVAAVALSKKAPQFRLLVVTEGGHPNRHQLDHLRSAAKGSIAPLTVIISSSAVLSFVASVVALFNSSIECFQPTQHHRAYSRIGLTAGESGTVAATICRLRQKLGVAEHAG